LAIVGASSVADSTDTQSSVAALAIVGTSAVTDGSDTQFGAGTNGVGIRQSISGTVIVSAIYAALITDNTSYEGQLICEGRYRGKLVIAPIYDVEQLIVNAAYVGDLIFSEE